MTGRRTLSIMVGSLRNKLHKGWGTEKQCKDCPRSACICLLRLPKQGHRLGGLKNRSLFPHSSEAWKSEIKVLAWLVSGEDTLFGLQMVVFLLCLHKAFLQYMWVKSELSGVFSHKDIDPTRSGPYLMTSSNLITFLETPSPNSVTLVIRILAWHRHPVLKIAHVIVSFPFCVGCQVLRVCTIVPGLRGPGKDLTWFAEACRALKLYSLERIRTQFKD